MRLTKPSRSTPWTARPAISMDYVLSNAADERADEEDGHDYQRGRFSSTNIAQFGVVESDARTAMVDWLSLFRFETLADELTECRADPNVFTTSVEVVCYSGQRRPDDDNVYGSEKDKDSIYM